MRMEWDFSELTDFAEQLSDTHSLETAIMTAAKKLAQELHSALLTRTPVKTGNLRAGWSRGTNLMFLVEDVGNGYEVTLSNSADNEGHMYGVDVNDGHRSFNQFGGPYGFVPGKLFVEKAVIATGAKCEEIIYHELEKWLEGAFT